MLVTRVRYVQPAFTVTAAVAEAVAEICLRLDGLPLALELAAARAKLFTPAELADRLRDRMAVLTTNTRDAPVRHRTLRTALEWSYDLLDEEERTLFRRLSVFVGAWTLDAAEQVCGDQRTDVLDVVGSLLDKSLVRRPTQGGVAECWVPFRRIFDVLNSGRRHSMMGASQIDPFGNQNFAAIGAD